MYPEEVSRVLSVKGMRRLTGRTVSTRSRIAIELRQVRKVGFAIDDESYCPGLLRVAAAVTDERGQPLGAISISGPSIRITRDRLNELGKFVRSVADDLSSELGGRRFAGGSHETGNVATSAAAKISALREERAVKKPPLCAAKLSVTP